MSGSPYRAAVPRTRGPRYQVTVDGIEYSGDTFAEVIYDLRRAGFETEMITRVAAKVTSGRGQCSVVTTSEQT